MPVYAPNSAGGPAADPSLWQGERYEVAGEIVRSAYTLRAEDGDFGQPRALWEEVMSDTDREHLAGLCPVRDHGGLRGTWGHNAP